MRGKYDFLFLFCRSPRRSWWLRPTTWKMLKMLVIFLFPINVLLIWHINTSAVNGCWFEDVAFCPFDGNYFSNYNFVLIFDICFTILVNASVRAFHISPFLVLGPFLYYHSWNYLFLTKDSLFTVVIRKFHWILWE